MSSTSLVAATRTLLAALVLLASAGVARADGDVNASRTSDTYDPASYLARITRGFVVSVPFGSLAWNPQGVAHAAGGTLVCDQDVDPPPSPCQPNDPGCSSVLERSPVQRNGRGAGGSGSPQVAQQLLARVEGSCRPASLTGENSRGFRPDVELSLPESGGLSQPVDKRRRAIAATVGINGSF